MSNKGFSPRCELMSSDEFADSNYSSWHLSLPGMKPSVPHLTTYRAISEGDASRIKYVRDQKEKENFDRLKTTQNDSLVLCSTFWKTCPLSVML
ncbi:hypothetical protein CDAR_227081 [Caerostris darwini]|uniref:Uncharacterized protein n=1 Tax=Caerostris darwini TaxID=1538125 RepID=A0AAV4PC66_9ARAC|nr:hypothetical protein CDAR_227081 [Caerostris darwini]